MNADALRIHSFREHRIPCEISFSGVWRLQRDGNRQVELEYLVVQSGIFQALVQSLVYAMGYCVP